MHPVAYFSCKLLAQRYSTVEKECLAIKLSIQAFHVYLMGRAFTIQRPQGTAVVKPVKGYKCSPYQLEPFSTKLYKYQKGHDNRNADALSRAW